MSTYASEDMDEIQNVQILIQQVWVEPRDISCLINSEMMLRWCESLFKGLEPIILLAFFPINNLQEGEIEI